VLPGLPEDDVLRRETANLFKIRNSVVRTNPAVETSLASDFMGGSAGTVPDSGIDDSHRPPEFDQGGDGGVHGADMRDSGDHSCFQWFLR
jgi:hypothetical protein